MKEKITKKRIIGITIIPVIIMTLLDLGTTYYGVCVNKGIELNVNAIMLAQKFGFIPAGLIWMIVQSSIAGLLGYMLWMGRKDEISRTFLIVIIVLFLTDFANTVVLNFNTLMYQEVGKGFAPSDQHSKDITPKQIEQIKETFVMEDFCRLW